MPKPTSLSLDPYASDSSTPSLSDPPSDTELDQIAIQLGLELPSSAHSARTPGSRRKRVKKQIPPCNPYDSSSDSSDEEMPTSRAKKIPNPRGSSSNAPAAARRGRPPGGVVRTPSELERLLELPETPVIDDRDLNTWMKLSYEEKDFGKPPPKEDEGREGRGARDRR